MLRSVRPRLTPGYAGVRVSYGTSLGYYPIQPKQPLQSAVTGDEGDWIVKRPHRLTGHR